mmetsp:Transcript_25893/g.61128  ORF Transcript_25893/g.61128 Transcript_25893/m.61128 type:complete len:203 (-) Transcript_25893:55-663(-)
MAAVHAGLLAWREDDSATWEVGHDEAPESEGEVSDAQLRRTLGEAETRGLRLVVLLPARSGRSEMAQESDEQVERDGASSFVQHTASEDLADDGPRDNAPHVVWTLNSIAIATAVVRAMLLLPWSAAIQGESSDGTSDTELEGRELVCVLWRWPGEDLVVPLAHNPDVVYRPPPLDPESEEGDEDSFDERMTTDSDESSEDH